MAEPSFSQFEWLHLQPAWDREPDFKTAVRLAGARFERWQPLWKMLFRGGFTDYEVGLLLGLREEYEAGVSRKG